MRLVEFIDIDTEGNVYLNPEQVICVRPGAEPGTSIILTTANANGLHTIAVDEEPGLVVARLENRA